MPDLLFKPSWHLNRDVVSAMDPRGCCQGTRLVPPDRPLRTNGSLRNPESSNFPSLQQWTQFGEAISRGLRTMSIARQRRTWPMGRDDTLFIMGYPAKTKSLSEKVLRYGLAFVAIAAALGLAYLFLALRLPQPFAVFALCAIAITFWYAGTGPGICATLLAVIFRNGFFEPQVGLPARIIYDLVFLLFAALMVQASRARHELAAEVARRTADLVRVNDSLKLEIAERARADEKLRESDAYLGEAQRLAHMGTWVWQVDGREAVYLSDEWYRIYDFNPQEGAPPWAARLERVHPEDRARWQSTIDQAMEKKSHYEIEFRILLPSGTVKHIHTVGRPVTNASGELVKFIGISMDVTERKRIEDTLRQSETYLAEAQRLTHTGSWAFDPQLEKMVYWSEETFRIFGLDAQEGPPNLERFRQRIHPEDRARVYQRRVEDFSKKREYVDEYRAMLADGTVKHVRVIGHPVLDERGEIREYIGTVVDVTDRKLAEQERERLHQLEADLAHMNRVSIMGELAASLAHEIKQPIAAAVTNARTGLRWLQRDPPDLQEVRETLSRIVVDVNRAADIIERNRSLYTRDTPRRERVDVNEIIRDMSVLLRDKANQHLISVRTELDPGLPAITADCIQLQQVLMNLMLNAVEAMKETGGELTIQSKLTDAGEILVAVNDLGRGLPVANPERIFDAFFTTKPQGTGMGLSISRRIIESHGGRLWASANGGRGATFQFTLPSEAVSSPSAA